MTEDHPEAGFYRDRRNGVPVAFWYRGDQLQCLCDGAVVSESDKKMLLWIRVAKSPCTRLAYEHRRVEGAWPDAPAAGPSASNLPSDPYDNLKARVDDTLESARAFLRDMAGKTPDQTIADKARNIKSDIEALAREARGWKDSAKRPILDAGAAIETKFKIVADPMAKAGEMLVAVYDAFLKAETARREQEARARFEVERKAAETARREIEAQRAKQMRDDPIAALTSPEPVLPPIPTAPEPVKVSVGGLTGNKAGLVTRRELVITDWDKALRHYGGHTEVRALLTKLARSDERDGVVLDFIEIMKAVGAR